MHSGTDSKIKIGTLIIILGLVATGCKKSSGGGYSSGGGVTPFVPTQGNWSGTTSQIRSVSFTTDGVKISSFTINVAFLGTYCSGSMTTTFISPEPTIIGNAFSYSGNSSSYTGTFSNANTSSGDFSVYNSYCDGTGRGTWSAQWASVSSLQLDTFGATTAPDKVETVQNGGVRIVSKIWIDKSLR